MEAIIKILPVRFKNKKLLNERRKKNCDEKLCWNVLHFLCSHIKWWELLKHNFPSIFFTRFIFYLVLFSILTAAAATAPKCTMCALIFLPRGSKIYVIRSQWKISSFIAFPHSPARSIANMKWSEWKDKCRCDWNDDDGGGENIKYSSLYTTSVILSSFPFHFITLDMFSYFIFFCDNKWMTTTRLKRDKKMGVMCLIMEIKRVRAFLRD